MPYVYSTLSNDQTFCDFEPGQKNGPYNIRSRVTVNGKANIATKHLVTPMGIMTKVTDEEMAFLEKDSEFQRFVKDGYIKVGKMKSDAEKVARDMTPRDQSSPLTPRECQEGSGRMPKIKPLETKAA